MLAPRRRVLHGKASSRIGRTTAGTPPSRCAAQGRALQLRRLAVTETSPALNLQSMSHAERTAVAASGLRAPAHCETLELSVVELGKRLRCRQDGHVR